MATLKYIGADANLQLVSLASQYTAGDGHMHLTTGHGARLPAAGDFWIRTNNATLKVFKVTARTDDEITVSCVTGYGVDANLDAGTELVWVLTAEALDQLKDDITKYRYIVSGLALQYDPTPDTTQTEDDEFNGTSLDAKWTVVTNTAAAVDYGAAWKSHIKLKFTANQDYEIKQSYAPEGAFSITARFRLSPYGQYGAASIVAYDADESDGIKGHYYYNSDTLHQNGLDSKDTGSWAGRGVRIRDRLTSLYLHLQRGASNNWSTFTSEDGLVWMPWATATYSKTFTVDHITIIANCDVSTPLGTQVGIDWVRRDWLTL